MKDFAFAPTFSERFLKNWGGPRALENCKCGGLFPTSNFYTEQMDAEGLGRRPAADTL